MITFEKLLERAKSEKIAICTTTKKQVLKLLLELNKSEFVWKGRNKVTARICGRAIYKFFLTFGFDKEVMFNSLKFCQDEGYAIIEFSDIDFNEKKIEPHKTKRISDDVIILNNQDRDNLIETLATPPEANEELKVLFKGEK